MGYAYERLTEKEKKNVEQISIQYAVNKIRIILSILETRGFEYTKVGWRTMVVDVTKKEDALIEKSFIDEACEDIDLLVVNQKSKLLRLEVEAADKTDYDQKAMDPIINKIFEHLSKSVASRSSPLQVDIISVSPIKVSEAMSVICHLDQSELSEVNFRFNLRNEPGKIDDSMIAWNGDSGWKELYFYLNNVTREDLEGLSKIASSQRFDEVYVDFNSCDEENIGAFFDTTLFTVKFDGSSLSIYPLIERDYSSDKKKIKAARLELIKSSLPENVALGVLGNSVVMETILGELEVFDIQPLRKVCRGVRDCIDDVKPEPHIIAYEIDFDLYSIAVKIESKHEKRLFYYHDKRQDAADFFMKKLHQEYLYDEKRALNDFRINLLHQKTCLEEFRITPRIRYDDQTSPSRIRVDIPATDIKELLKGRKTALKVKNLTIVTDTREDVIRILPHIDKDFLKKIIIICQNQLTGRSTDLVEIAGTEQWKRASQLSIERSTVTAPIREMNITHFSTVDILVETLSSDDVVYLKTDLFKSSILEKFKIKFKTSTVDEKLHNLIGEPYRITPNFKKIWYFRMTNPDYYLHIVLDTQDLLDDCEKPKPKTIVLSRVPKEDTPFF